MSAAAVAARTPEAVTQTGEAMRVQATWASTPIVERLGILKSARHELARVSERLVDAMPVSLERTRADSYAAEVLPLLAACRFLEQQAQAILKPRRLGKRGLPFWLAGLEATVHRVPFGVMLVIAPANYPLFLAGAQTLQALAAGNAVIWKPGRDGAAVAEVFARALAAAGLPEGLLRISDESAEAAVEAIARGVDKIFFTGSAATGRTILKLAAERATPVVAELSGCDAVIVLPSADRSRVIDALAFGMRLNGSATCMAPRRLILIGMGHEALISRLRERFARMTPVSIGERVLRRLEDFLAEAVSEGAAVCGEVAQSMGPVLVFDANTRMQVAQADIFAPVLTVLTAADEEEAVAMEELCPYGLTVSIFGERSQAERLGSRLNVGTVIVNDLIVPTADPRVPFGGRRASGFGATRGAEGLLEMTAAKVISVQRGRTIRHYDETGEAHEELFRAAVAMSHGATWGGRFSGLSRLVSAARRLGQRDKR